MKRPIKVGFCVAYDWDLLAHSLPLIYDHADKICLSIDDEYISWGGSPFAFDDSQFNKLISSIDKNHKISIFKENFHLPTLTPMQNEVRQRKMMAAFLGEGGWHVQLDADEYFLDFSYFVQKLNDYRGTRKVNICVPWTTLFKKLDHSWLIISPLDYTGIEYVPVATLEPHYEHGRINGYFNYKVNAPLIHQSWARSREEIETKVNNWGHKNDFDAQEFIKFWERLTSQTYKAASNFHPIKPEVWPSLKEIPGESIEDVIVYLKQRSPLLVPVNELKKQNSIFRSRISGFLKRVRARD